MKKKALSLALALVMCLGLIVPASAVSLILGSEKSDEISLSGSTQVGRVILEESGSKRSATLYAAWAGEIIGVRDDDWGDESKWDIKRVVQGTDGIFRVDETYQGAPEIGRNKSYTIPVAIFEAGTEGYWLVGPADKSYKGVILNIGWFTKDDHPLIVPSAKIENSATVSINSYVEVTHMLACEESAVYEELYYNMTCVAPVEVSTIADGLTFVAFTDDLGLVVPQNWEEYKDPRYSTPVVRSGAKFVLSEPGVYHVEAESYWSPTWLFHYNFTITVLAPESTTPTQPQQPEQPQQPIAETIASPTNDKLEVNGAAADPTVYKINGSNYFKIRDVAALLNGTEKQFAVGYDGTKNAVTATTGQGYDKQSGDLAGAAAGGDQTAAASNDAIYVNGGKITAEVYKIGGSNYFKLRDLGKALNFYVGWSAERGMYIETDKPYSE